ncbi:hypothetical protein M758_5G140100, partial [Ceratodon purpureus]
MELQVDGLPRHGPRRTPSIRPVYNDLQGTPGAAHSNSLLLLSSHQYGAKVYLHRLTRWLCVHLRPGNSHSFISSYDP